jgi:hypothetical protein
VDIRNIFHKEEYSKHMNGTNVHPHPIGCTLLSNIVLFCFVIVKIEILPEVNSAGGKNRNTFLIYIKLTCLTGVTWIFGFIYQWTLIKELSYIFIFFLLLLTIVMSAILLIALLVSPSLSYVFINILGIWLSIRCVYNNLCFLRSCFKHCPVLLRYRQN